MSAKTLALLILFVQPSFFMVKAQEIKDNDAQENIFKIGGADASFGVVRKFDNRYEGTKGSPFYIDNWSEGSITTKDDRQILFSEMKYDAFEDEVIINKPNSGHYYFQKNKTKSFMLKEEKTGKNINFVLHHHFKDYNDLQFYRLIYQGKINILEHIKIVFEKADYEGGYSNDKRYDEFKKYSELYYCSKADLQPKKLKRTTKAISNIFPDHTAEMRKIIIDNRYDPKSEDDLIKIFSYYQNIE